jgi:hypothetical protein
VNCWNTAKVAKPQHSDEICASVRAIKICDYVAISSQAANSGRFNDYYVGPSGSKRETPVRDEDIVWSDLKESAAFHVKAVISVA